MIALGSGKQSSGGTSTASLLLVAGGITILKPEIGVGRLFALVDSISAGKSFTAGNWFVVL